MISRFVVVLCALFAICASSNAQGSGAHRVWSDKPAFTQVIDNEDEHGLTSCLYDGVYEGDAFMLQPMAKCLPKKTRYWEQGEETNYLNPLTNVLTRGKYPNLTVADVTDMCLMRCRIGRVD